MDTSPSPVPEHSTGGMAGVAAPLAGLGGEHTAVPVGVLMTLGMLASLAGLLVIVGHRGTDAGH